MMQVRLLRAIQEREVQRVGSNQTISVDVRLIAATHRDLAAEVNAGRFRQDLYYRLNVVAIEVPSLRQRREDIPLLANHFLQRFAERNRKAVKVLRPGDGSADSLRLVGNIRELENTVERAVVLLTGNIFPNASCRWRLRVRRSRWYKVRIFSRWWKSKKR